MVIEEGIWENFRLWNVNILMVERESSGTWDPARKRLGGQGAKEGNTATKPREQAGGGRP